MNVPRGICRLVIQGRLLAFGSLILLAMPGEAWAENKARFEAQKTHDPSAAIEVIDLAGERAGSAPPGVMTAPDGRTDLSVILWDELKRPRGPGPSAGARSGAGNQASMANGRALR